MGTPGREGEKSAQRQIDRCENATFLISGLVHLDLEEVEQDLYLEKNLEILGRN